MNETGDIKMLQQKYVLSEDQFQAILGIIIRRYTKRVLPSPKSVAVLLGAQPGAGKTELQKEAEYQLLKNVVVCNADNFRDFHPFADEIKKKHENAYPEITAGYAQRWNDALCKYCLCHKLNFILETTFTSGSRLNETIKGIKDVGYQLDIKLLAVSPRLSLLGTYLRYENSKMLTGTGRSVPKEAHDQRYKAIPFTLQKVQEQKLYDNIYIYARSIVVEQTDLTEGVTLIAHNPENPLRIYQEELQRPWPEKMKQYFNKKSKEITRMMERRNANFKEIETFKKSVGLESSIGQNISRKRRPRL